MPRPTTRTDGGVAPDPAPADRFRHSELAGDIPFLLARARASSSGAANVALEAVGLKVRAFSVLWLACEGLQPSQRELSEFLNLDPSQIVALVDELEGRGAVTRQADPRDRRQRIITPTPAGRRLFRKARALAEAADDRSLSMLTADERRTLGELLVRVALPAPEDPTPDCRTT